ncbi:MAG: Flp pilus assembly protein CpaB [Proteobacteria bacterium]|nr:Flp pilus assembly protein CpaB [Pseudomonadota bacterium]
MNSKRIVFLLLAVIVAGTTAFLARAWMQSERAAILAQAQSGVSRAQPAVVNKVLVAKTTIRTGHIVKPDDMRWQVWPAGDLAQAYVIEGKRPLTDFVGAVARGSIGAGEPITETKLVLVGTRGFMSAVLQPGMRAVSVAVSATSAVSGFIYAGDRVDVLLTHTLANQQGWQHKATETILRNARVIAMDQKVDAAPTDKPDVAKTATLELTPKQTEIITLAVKMGDLSLVLRSLQENADSDSATTEDAPAEPGDSYTRDVQVSRLIADGPGPQQTTHVVLVLRGGSQSKQTLDDGNGDGDGDETKPAENKTQRTTTFTRTPSVSP